MTSIEINCDLGEIDGDAGLSNDLELLPWIDSANVACGGHAGSEDRLRQLAAACRHFHVAFGAHPGYPDRENFGRRILSLSATQLFETLCEQIQLAKSIADSEGIPLTHVKPHGALYNLAAENAEIAAVVVRAIQQTCGTAKLIGLSGSQLITVGQAAGLITVSEAFADRNYHSDGRLVSRQETNAVLHDVDDIAQRVRRMVDTQTVISLEGDEISLVAETICVHSDTKNAVLIARQLRRAVERSP
jgi:UPF0271 protein